MNTLNPKVSVCVPNLNTRPYLAERFETILNQTFGDWEMLVYDSHSDDGAWELIQELAAREPRVRAWQGPREGTPGSWNPCLKEARGEYVYIATSDDTMAPDCLDKLVRALDAHPDCDLAHCPLRFINEKGQDLPKVQSWWWEASLFARSSGAAKNLPHIRRAPFDGLLLLLGQTVYLSLTQLLIRRSLFDRIGYFESRWGSVGDFNWDMRASLVASTIHVPDTWGSWRLHPHQATASARPNSPEYALRVDDMIDHALQTCEPQLSPTIRSPLNARWRKEAEEIRRFLGGQRSRSNSWSRKKFILQGILSGSSAAPKYLKARLGGRKSSLSWDADIIRGWLREAGVEAISPLA